MTTNDGTLLGYASSLLGVPYKWGGTDPTRGMDCSGFVQNVYGALGIHLPRTSQQQVSSGQDVAYKAAMPGDLVFYDVPGEGNASHVGIYVGNGQMIDSPHTGASVQIEPIWQGAYFKRVQIPKGVTVGVASATPNPDGTASGINAPAATHYNMGQLESQYGYAASFFASDPALTKLIKQAVSGQWTQDEFSARLRGSKWFQTHTDTQRAWIQLQTSDPASAKRQLAMQATDIQHLASQEGVNLDPATVKSIAQDALRNGLNTDQIRQAVVSHLKVDTTQGGAPAGDAAHTYSNLKQLAYNYGVPMTEQAYDTWTQKIQTGGATSDDYLAYVKGQASQIYPGLTQQIASGMTTQDAADSYRKLYSQYLEMPETSVSLNDPLIKGALSYTPPKTAGSSASSTPTTPGAMPMWQFEQQVKSDPRWLKTQNARDALMGTALKVGSDFGFYGGA